MKNRLEKVSLIENEERISYSPNLDEHQPLSVLPLEDPNSALTSSTSIERKDGSRNELEMVTVTLAVDTDPKPDLESEESENLFSQEMNDNTMTTDGDVMKFDDKIRFSRVCSLSWSLLSSVLYCGGIALSKRVNYLTTAETCTVQCITVLFILAMSLAHSGVQISVPKFYVRGLVIIAVTGNL